MKILTILTYYYPHWTGLTAHAVDVAEGLAARGHAVTVLTTRHSPELARTEIHKGVRVIRLKPVARLSRGMITPAFSHAAARLIAQHDVVQIHTPLPEAPIVALLCRALKRPLLMTHHGDLVMPQGHFNQFLQKVGFALLLSAGRLADAVTSYSRDYAEHSDLLRRFRHKLTCIYPPVHSLPPDREAISAWRVELGLEDRLLIGFAGRWVEEKGFDYLLQALPLIRETYPEAHLIYAGEKNVIYEDFYARCEPLIEAQKEHLTFLGLIRDPQRMANFYGMCDLFVQPSRTDMMGLVQIEAMLCGTPVVVSDIPGARVAVQETGFGRLAPPHDPQGLAQTIIETLRERPRYMPTYDAVRKVFNTGRTLEDYEQVMERIVEQSAQRRRTLNEAQRQARTTFQAISAGALLSSPSQVPQSAASSNIMLSPNDRATLERLLGNEADMAFRHRARALMEYLDLRDGDVVLDCGCGMGVYLMIMSRLRNVRLYGVDGDLSRLHWAEREHLPAQLSSVDIHHLPFPDASFDKVLFSEVLEHLADDRGALREIYRILKPGGTLAISVPHANYPFWWDPINKTLEALGRRPIRNAGPIAGIWSNHWRLYYPDELRELLQSAGYTIESLEEQTHYSFPFIHFIVYGIGKPLIEHNLLPAKLRASADRFSAEQNSGSWLNPINLGVRIFRLFDARNEQLRGDERTFVNIVAKARKIE